MKKYYCFTTFLIYLILSGCATPYQRESGCLFFLGGYRDGRVLTEKNVFWVTFDGNGFTSASTVERYLLKRCCEITIENDYDYFIILALDLGSSLSFIYTPGRSFTEGVVEKPYSWEKDIEYKYKEQTTYYPSHAIPVTKYSMGAVIQCGKKIDGKIPDNAFHPFELLNYIDHNPESIPFLVAMKLKKASQNENEKNENKKETKKRRKLRK